MGRGGPAGAHRAALYRAKPAPVLPILGQAHGGGLMIAPVSRDLQQDIEQFLYEEAALIDDGRFHEWLDLFTDDVRYWMPIRETLQAHPDGLHPEDVPAVPLMDDDKSFLRL